MMYDRNMKLVIIGNQKEQLQRMYISILALTALLAEGTQPLQLN